jgi:transcriptional regulator with XRE-family HTH domain
MSWYGPVMTRERTSGGLRAFDREDPAFYEALGRAIKVVRTQQDVSRKDLAERAGLSYAYLSDIETGRGRPSSKALLAVAQALGLTPSELLQDAELYGALEDLTEGAETPAPSAVDARRWFHEAMPLASEASSPTASAPSRLPTREQLQRLARSRLAGRSATSREELHAMIEGLSDADAALMLDMARRLLGSTGRPS